MVLGYLAFALQEFFWGLRGFLFGKVLVLD